MRRLVVCLALAALGFAPAPFPRPDRSKVDPDRADLARMQGTWRVKYQTDGERVIDRTGWLVVESGSRMRYFSPGGDARADYRMTLNSRSKPKAMDLVGGDKKLWRGTYLFRGGELITCLPLSPEEYSKRPPDCEPGPARLFKVFERVSR